jgi:hypothetical protein
MKISLERFLGKDLVFLQGEKTLSLRKLKRNGIMEEKILPCLL